MKFASKLFVFFLAAANASTANAQFQCTFSGAQDETGCISATDGVQHCVWCQLRSFGFCVGEEQAESMEQNIPGVHCDRYSDNDDATTDDDQTPGNDDDQTPKTDDETPPKTDDETPSTDDDNIKPNDDSLPDDYWMCLQKKTEKDCTDDCTWCDTKAGFGVCMTGPSAESASKSEWFTCKTGNTTTIAEQQVAANDPYDTSCSLAPDNTSKEGCDSLKDADGNPCEFCSKYGVFNVCVNHDQAEMVQQLGFDCDTDDYDDDDDDDDDYETEEEEIYGENEQEPVDTSCVMAYIQDPSKEGCMSASDLDGNACEFCNVKGPAGSLGICLTAFQADYGKGLGFTCDNDDDEKIDLPPDFLECLEHYQGDDCRQTSSCTWCHTQVGMDFCLSNAVADATKECSFFDCEFGQQEEEKQWKHLGNVTLNRKENMHTPFDPVCLAAGMGSDDAEAVCNDTLGSDGSSCVWCNAAGVFGLCLSSDDAATVSQYLQCDAHAVLAEQ